MIYSMDSGDVLLASASVTKSALGTVKLINGFWNPTTSYVKAVIRKVIIATTSGTPGGPFYWNYISGVTVNSTSTGLISPSLLSHTPVLGYEQTKMNAQTFVVVTVVGAATTALNQLCVIGGPAAVAAGAGIYSLVVDYPTVGAGAGGDDFIVVPPGTLIGLTCTAAGTTHHVQSTIYWQELPL